MVNICYTAIRKPSLSLLSLLTDLVRTSFINRESDMCSLDTENIKRVGSNETKQASAEFRIILDEFNVFSIS